MIVNLFYMRYNACDTKGKNMNALKTKSLERIESRMEATEEGTLRRKILECAKNFKSSWLELGQYLYTVWKDKCYKEWGYLTFEAYTAKEIGIRKQTAMKLLKSYYFLEKEEPAYLTHGHNEESAPAVIPSYEAVNLLRLAKNNESVEKSDYHRLKKDVFEKGRDPREIKKDLTAMMRSREELDPEEARERKRASTIKRFLGTLKAFKTEFEASKTVSAAVLKDVAVLIRKLEEEV